jgi:hypothetical protein
VTVSDNEASSRARLTPEERAKLGAEAWRLADIQGLSVRSIHERFLNQGHRISHMTVWRLLKEAYEQAKFLDLIGPAEQRVGAIGRLQTAIEKTLAAIDTNEVEFDKGMARYVQLEGMLMKLTGSAMPSRIEVSGDPERATPDMAFIDELRKAKEHAQRMAEMEENDGLDND